MHRGVQEFIRWVEGNPGFPGVKVHSPASATELAHLEHQLGTPLPADLRLVLSRFNGGVLPSGVLLSVGVGQHTIEASLRRLAEKAGTDFLDSELLLPFHTSVEGSVLAFDRSAGPVPDTWPIVDWDEETSETRLVHRTFDSWCRFSISEWGSPDFLDAFSLEKYLQRGKRHVAVDPDVSSAHATVAHALKRAGEPELALASYLEAARCIPALGWCDWEALKLAALLDLHPEALEAASRLCARGPMRRWETRDTTPIKVAHVVARIATREEDHAPWVRLLEQLIEQASGEERHELILLRRSTMNAESLPPPPSTGAPTLPNAADGDALWKGACEAYRQGELKDEHLLLDPTLEALRRDHPIAALLRMPREF